MHQLAWYARWPRQAQASHVTRRDDINKMQILIGAACVPGTVIRVHLRCLGARQASSPPAVDVSVDAMVPHAPSGGARGGGRGNRCGNAADPAAIVLR